jgi:hypothetical protein
VCCLCHKCDPDRPLLPLVDAHSLIAAFTNFDDTCILSVFKETPKSQPFVGMAHERSIDKCDISAVNVVHTLFNEYVKVSISCLACALRVSHLWRAFAINVD